MFAETVLLYFFKLVFSVLQRLFPKKRLALFIALRYLEARRKQSAISVITFISVLGIALGVSALIIVIAVMNGFEGDLREKILGTNAHMFILQRDGDMSNYQDVIGRIQRACVVKHIKGIAPFILNQAMLSSGKNVSGVVLRGIDPALEGNVTKLKRNIELGDINLLDQSSTDTFKQGNEQQTFSRDGIIIGKELARNLGLYLDDSVTLILPLGTITPMGMSPKITKLKVVGIFSSGLYEYDVSCAYVSLKTAQRLFGMGDEITGIEVKLDDMDKVKEVGREVIRVLGIRYRIQDWIDMNHSFFSAMKLERIALFIILTLIILVAAFNIIGTLIMMVIEKNKDIGILKSTGATSKNIRDIFMLQGIGIGILGTLIGFVTGFGISWSADFFKLIKLNNDLASAYSMSYLPFKIDLISVIIICSSSLLISFLATVYPSWQAAKLDPVVAIRYE
ncbi:MAG: lipoprotein-releasing ABC transporter permease subunit [bacterium]